MKMKPNLRAKPNLKPKLKQRPSPVRDPWAPEANHPAALARAFVRDHLRVASESARDVSLRIGTTLLVWLLVGIALALPGGLFLVQANLDSMASGWEGRPGVSVYFEPGAAAAVIEGVAERVQARPEVDAVTVITAAEALATFAEQADVADALALLDENPLPASLRATLRPEVDPAGLDALAQAIGQEADIAEVVIERTWLERVIDISRAVRRLGMLLGGLFGLGAVLVTASSVRLAIETRLEELRVLKLVGATDAQIRRPLLYLGAFYGLGGGLFGAMIISFGLVLLEAPLDALAGSYGESLRIVAFDGGFLLTLLVCGAVLGVLGAALATYQRLAELEIH